MEIKTLKNGIRVIIDDKNDDKNIIRVGAYILGGTYTESKKTMHCYSMLQYLLEHLVSGKWPDGKRNIKRLERKKIKYNSRCDDYEVCVQLEGTTDMQDVMLDMLVSCLTDFKPDMKTFEDSKNKISKHLNRYRNDFNSTVHEIIYSKHRLFDCTHEERAKSINNLEINDIIEFAAHAIVPEKLVFFISGSVADFSVFKKYLNTLSKLQDSSPVFSMKNILKFDSLEDKGIFRIKNDDSTKRIQLRWPINCTSFNFKKVALIDAFGYSIHRELNQKMCDEYNAVDYVNVKQFFDPVNSNLSYLYIETHTPHPEKIKPIIIEIVRTLSNYSSILTQELLTEFKDKCPKLSRSRVGFCASQLLWNQSSVKDFEDVSDIVNAIQLHDLLHIAETEFNTDDVYLLYNNDTDVFSSDDHS